MMGWVRYGHPRDAVYTGAIVASVILVYALAALTKWPTLAFSADSWSLLELARSFERHAPYEFNTYRAFGPETTKYSAAFPLGYPYLLFLARKVLPGSEVVGVIINLAAAAATLVLAAVISRKSVGSALPGVAAGALLLTYVPYVWEVFGGRTIPITVLALTCALACAHRHAREGGLWAAALAGAFAGIAMLVRFDAAVLAVLLGVAAALATRRVSTAVAYLVSVTVFASPWALFCWTHFHRLWFSDNSWVATSAVPAYVLDYPASASHTLTSDPAMWVWKCIHNVWPLVQDLAGGLLRCPGLCVLAAYWLWARRSANGIAAGSLDLYRSAPILALLALLPQLSVGYFEHRYWTLLWFLCSLALALQIWCSRGTPTAPTPGPAVLVLAAGLSVLVALLHWTSVARQRPAALVTVNRQDAALRMLDSCQKREPLTTYVVIDATLSTKYGARFVTKNALLPSNWQAMPAATRAAFATRFSPVRFIEPAILEQLGATQDCSIVASAPTTPPAVGYR